ncbi:MAG: electron transport complex subunit RsxC [Alistipes sp.]|jgi:electron transport complex protein RnfC|nr:electron transport complex subunit RsxC [Alistipes sp.]
MLKTFRKGGIHPPDNKLSAGVAVETLPLPAVVVVPLSQHIGAPAVAEVAKGDRVVTGQQIAKAGGFVSAAVHSPVSGVVTALDAVPNGSGVKTMSVTIAVEGDEWAPEIDRSPELVAECTLSAEEIVAKIAAAGVVGMGGATFPTSVKLSPPPGKKAEMLIINGVECEPFLTSDHRVMIESAPQVIVGVALLARALGVERSFIGVENNKPDAVELLRRTISLLAGVTRGTLVGEISRMEVVPLRVQYPQGGEKQLIEAVTGRQVPSGALPIETGCVVQNVGTALAVYEAVQKNKPLVERVVTVTGRDITHPSNFLARIGTPVSTLIEAAGGVQGEGPVKVIGGGPMMGRAMSNPDAPVTKGTSGVLVLTGAEAARCTETDCIRCAACVGVCPMGLEPYLLSRLAQKQMWDESEAGVVMDCIECGSCAWVCPARIPLLDWIRLGKTEVGKIVRARTTPAPATK